MSLTSMNQLKMIFVQNLPTTSKLTQKNSSNFANELTLNQKSSWVRGWPYFFDIIYFQAYQKVKLAPISMLFGFLDFKIDLNSFSFHC